MLLKRDPILAVPVEVGWLHTNSYVPLHSFFVPSRVKSLIPRLPTTFPLTPLRIQPYLLVRAQNTLNMLLHRRTPYLALRIKP